MADDKRHFWMATAKITFTHPGNEDAGVPPHPGVRELNVLVDTTRKRVNADTIDTIRQTCLMKCQEKYSVEPSWVADFLIQNICYLGLMSPKEYMGNTRPTQITAKE